MKKSLSCGAILRTLAILSFLAITSVNTQVFAQEVQVAFDVESDTSSVGKVFTINRELRNQLGLFPEYPGFEQASLYRQAQGRYSLEITSVEDGKISRVTSTLDSAQVAALRADFRSRVVAEQPRSLVDQSGRSHFLWTTAAAAFLYYGPAFAANVGSDASAISGSYLLGGGLGFFLPYLITEHTRMTDGMAAAARVGAILGIGHTALAFGAADAFDDDGRAFLAVSSIVSAGELAAGAALANKYDVGAGRANLIGVGGVFGTSIAVEGTLMLLGAEAFGNESPALLMGTGLVGSLGGMYLANQVALNTNYTTGDAKAVMMGGLTGSLLTSAILSQLVSSELTDIEGRIMMGLLAGGTFGGCYAAHKWLGRRNFSDGDGNLTILGGVVGGLVGTGIAAMGKGEGSEIILLPAIGAAAGYALMMSSLGKGTEDRGMLGTEDHERYGDAGTIDQKRNAGLLKSVDFQFNPIALGMAAAQADVPQSSGQRITSIPLAGMSVKL